VMNATARLIYSSSRFDQITPLLRQLHWLKAKERIGFKLAILVFKCVHGSAPPYLANELIRPADSLARCVIEVLVLVLSSRNFKWSVDYVILNVYHGQ